MKNVLRVHQCCHKNFLW